MGLMGPSGGRGEAAKGQPRAPPPPVRIGQGGGRRAAGPVGGGVGSTAGVAPGGRRTSRRARMSE